MRKIAVFSIFVFCAALGFAGDTPHIDEAKIQVILQDFSSEFPYLAKPITFDNKGFKIKKGAVTPSDAELARRPALKKVGESVKVTDVEYKDGKLLFEIDHGYKKKGHRVSWSVGVGGIPVGPAQDDGTKPAGTVVELSLDDVELPAERDALRAKLKELLAPVLDFDAKSQSQAQADRFPPGLKKLIMEEHKICTGMDQSMVVAAKDRPREHETETDETGAEYTDWFYDDPAVKGGTIIVRFVKGRVTLVQYLAPQKSIVNDMTVCPEVAEFFGLEEKKAAEQKDAPQGPQKPPTLKRPGEPDDPTIPKK